MQSFLSLLGYGFIVLSVFLQTIDWITKGTVDFDPSPITYLIVGLLVLILRNQEQY